MWAASLNSGDEAVQDTQDAIEGVMPAPGADGVLRQSSVEVDLVPGWTGVLEVNGVEIPRDELNCVDNCDQPPCDISQDPSVRQGCRDPRDPQNRVYFVPDEGKVLDELPQGRICAVAVIWRVTESRDRATTVPWCFVVSV